MSLLRNIFWFTVLFWVYLISAFLFKANHIWMSLVVLMGAFISAYFYFKNNDVTYFKGFFILNGLVLLTLIGILLTGGILHIYTYVIFIPICNFLGWCFSKSTKIVYVLVAAIFIGFASFVFLPNIVNYANNINPRITKALPDISLIDKDKQEVKLDKNKIIILDFWTTACGVCFKNFPDLETVYLKYKNNPDIEIYSVNIPLDRDEFHKTKGLVTKLNYKFPTLYATAPDETEKDLNIRAYPSLMIIKNDKILYKGCLNIDKNIFIYNTYNEIERIIEENQ